MVVRAPAARFEQLAASLDPDTAQVEGTDDLREIATAAEAVRADDARLCEAVVLARERGRSWNHIALALGVSRQAARQRFAERRVPDRLATEKNTADSCLMDGGGGRSKHGFASPFWPFGWRRGSVQCQEAAAA